MGSDMKNRSTKDRCTTLAQGMCRENKIILVARHESL
jgi:hypothetical protein